MREKMCKKDTANPMPYVADQNIKRSYPCWTKAGDLFSQPIQPNHPESSMLIPPFYGLHDISTESHM
ncbi:hypothetical protein AAC03nite_00760 [Alicyclobacillus acidoterrestris]|nr:hypothetical protein AAC03nite_00760 [Alicyclobacillus acidoterrestris]